MKNRFFYLIVTLVFFGVDQLSKIWVKGSLNFGDRIPLIPAILGMTYVENSGGAFGIFGSLSSPYRTLLFSFFALGAIALILYYLLKVNLESRLIYWGLALILSGAIGNFIDRIRLGYVIDFIDLHYKTHHWPIFNIADTTICIGLALIGFSYIFTSKKGKKEPSDVS